MNNLTYVLSLLLFIAGSTVAGTIEVRKDQGIGSIQAAIDLSAAHDTIYVHQGTYHEHNIVINKPLLLVGFNRPIIDGDHKSEIVTIASDSVVLRGFQIQNVGFSFTKDYS